MSQRWWCVIAIAATTINYANKYLLTFRLSRWQEEATEQDRKCVQRGSQTDEREVNEQIMREQEAVYRFFSPFSGVCARQGSEEQAWVGSLWVFHGKLREVGTGEQVYQAA